MTWMKYKGHKWSIRDLNEVWGTWMKYEGLNEVWGTWMKYEGHEWSMRDINKLWGTLMKYEGHKCVMEIDEVSGTYRWFVRVIAPE